MAENIQLSAELSEFQNSQMSRRRLLQLLGSGIASITGIDILASCGGSIPPTPTTNVPQVKGIVTINLEGTRQLAPYYSGYNNVAIQSPSWQVPDTVNAAKELKPGTLRYPGGTIANYWDWKKGWFLSNAPQSLQSAPFSQYRLQELQIAVQATGAMPIYVLNMLTSDLNNQLDMLRTARDMGLPVQFIEMGNEYYLKLTQYVRKFPTGQDYGKVATTWIKAIRAEFPNVKIAVSGSLHSNAREPRQANWNSYLLQNLQGADAIALHPYVKVGNWIITQAATADNAMKVVGSVLADWQGFDDQIKSLPPDIAVWFTEYNLNDLTGTILRTWIQGITTAVMTLAYLENDRVALVCLYDMIGKTGMESLFYDSKTQGKSNTPLTQYSLTADGWSMRLVNDTIRGMTSAQKISFNPNPLINGSNFSYPSLQGWIFTNGATMQTFIINRSADNYLCKGGSMLPQGSHFQQLMSDPFKLITGPGSLTIKSGTLQDQLVLPAYSVTQLKPAH